MRVWGKSCVGSGEGPNEDSIGWDEARGLALVADGMGGYSCGEVASAIVKDALLAPQEPYDLITMVLRAHETISAAAKERSDASGMGSTVVALSVKDRIGNVVWVGDSRAYLWRRGRLQRLTRDHSFAESLRDIEDLSETAVRLHPGHNLVLQALGRDQPAPSKSVTPLRRGDRILLCSDGLSAGLRDEQIRDVLKRYGSLEDVVEGLVEAAVAGGSRDDISVVLADYGGPNAPGTFWHWSPRSGIWLSVGGGLLMAVLIAAIAWWLGWRR